MTMVNSGLNELNTHLSPNNSDLMLSGERVNPHSAGTFFRRQNLTYKDGTRTEIIKIFIMAVDP